MKRCLPFCLVVFISLLSVPLFAQSVPELSYDSAPNFLKLPADVYLGEAAGVAQNSKGHIFVFTRSGETQLFEFDAEGNFLREISPRNPTLSPLRTPCASTNRTTSGPWTKA